MKQPLIKCMILSILFIVTSACSNHDGKADWAYGFIKWKGISYKVTGEKLDKSDIAAKLGQVESYTNDENFSSRLTYSNKYPAGTEFFKINGLPEKEAIAIAVESTDGYIKLVRAE